LGGSWRGSRTSPPAFRDEAALDFRQTEFRAIGSDQEVTGEGDLHAARQGVTLDGRDQRLGQFGLRHAGKAGAGQADDLAAKEGSQIHPSAKISARAGDHAGTHRLVRLHVSDRPFDG
jgi:hypothetical protein